MNGLARVRAEPEVERKKLDVVWFASPWVPAEWIKAHGLQPRGIWRSDAYDLGAPSRAGSCAFAAGTLDLARYQKNAACIFTTHCDQLRRTFDLVHHDLVEQAFLFNLPATGGSAVPRTLYRAELDRLSRFLVAIGGARPTANELAGIMADYRAKRTALCRAPSQQARVLAEAILNFHWDGSVAEINAPHRAPEGIPLAVVGGPLPASRLELFDVVAELGGRIVLNATEAGERSVWPSGSSAEKALDLSALVDRLAEEYLNHCVDVFRRPNTRLYEWLGSHIQERKPRGIILWHYTGCDLWSAEAQSLREFFGLPLLLLEADDSTSLTLRDRSRLQAFLESLV